MGIFPVGTLVGLTSGEVAVVTHEHPTDPFRPRVTLVKGAEGRDAEASTLINTGKTDRRGELGYAAEATLDPERVEIDPLAHL